jgi:hypothetical protein
LYLKVDKIMNPFLPYIFNNLDIPQTPKILLLTLFVRVQCKVEPHYLDIQVADDKSCRIIAQGGNPATIAWATKGTPRVYNGESHDSPLLVIYVRKDVLGYEAERSGKLWQEAERLGTLYEDNGKYEQYNRKHPLAGYGGYVSGHTVDATHYEPLIGDGKELRFKCLNWVPVNTLVSQGEDSTLDIVEPLLIHVAKKSLRIGVPKSSREYKWLNKNFPIS